MGRAVVGGLLLGPLGAIVGSVFGTGKKTKSSNKFYFIINSRSSVDDEIKLMSFEVVGATMGLTKFVNALKEIIGVDENPLKEINL